MKGKRMTPFEKDSRGLALDRAQIEEEPVVLENKKRMAKTGYLKRRYAQEMKLSEGQKGCGWV